eukprot:6119056-Pleurochrysis_carterae.AAC.2
MESLSQALWYIFPTSVSPCVAVPHSGALRRRAMSVRAGGYAAQRGRALASVLRRLSTASNAGAEREQSYARASGTRSSSYLSGEGRGKVCTEKADRQRCSVVQGSRRLKK